MGTDEKNKTTLDEFFMRDTMFEVLFRHKHMALIPAYLFPHSAFVLWLLSIHYLCV